MILLNKDKEEIRSIFLDEEFLNFMFEMLIGNKSDSNGTLWREVYTHEIAVHMVDLSKLLIYIFLIKCQ